MRALVVDDSESMRGYLASLLESRAFDVDTAEDGRKALALLESGAAPDVVLLDVKLPGSDGVETLRLLREREVDLPVVMLSVVASAPTIVRAMQAGAFDYLTKPFDDDELEATLVRAVETTAPRRRAVARGAEAETDAGEAVWQSAPMRQILEVIDQIGDTDVTVLIQGESGVGKEIVARAIHARSDRAEQRFVKVNCAALPEDLLESELFGYEPGAFTGASQRKLGKFEQASGGTIFLDEIAEMSPGLQAKLLHVLQEQRFARLGANVEVDVDVRVVCATHRPLREMVGDRSFREDLYFRLNVVNIEIPPLRDRRDEIPVLFETFLRRYSAFYEKPTPRPSKKLVALLEDFAFPGNVRQLENMVKRLVVLESEDSIRVELEGRAHGGGAPRSELQALLEEVEASAGEVPLREIGRRVAQQAERETIGVALQRTKWNRKQAARMLSVSYKTLLQKIRDCGLDAEAP